MTIEITPDTATPSPEAIPYVDSDDDRFDDELPEISGPSVDSIIAIEEAAQGARVWQAKNPRIHYVRDFYFLAPYLTGAKQFPAWTGVDIETEVEERPDIGPGWRSGLNPIHTAIALVQIEIDCDVYLVHWSAPKRLSDVPGIELLKQYLALPYVWKCIHNAEFEWKFLLNELGTDLVIESVWDTKLGENILSEGRGFTLTQGKYWVPRRDEKPKKFLALGDCIQRRYGYAMDKGFDVRLSYRRGEELTVRQRAYAADDAIWCRMLAEDQHTDMTRMETSGVRMLTTMHADCEMVEAVGRMALAGIYVDKLEAQKLWAELEVEITQLTERVRGLLYLPGDGDPVLTEKTKKPRVKAGKPVFNLLNLNSESQMVPRLQRFGIPVTDYRAATLKHFKDHAGIEDILLVKQLDKLRGTYLEPAVKKFIHPRTQCIYVNLNLAVATTGRLSSSHPNMQTLPTRTKWGKRVKRLIQPRSGNVLIEWDFGNIELKLIGEIFGDQNMIRAFQAHMDLHALVGAVVLYGITDFSWENLVYHYNSFMLKFKHYCPACNTSHVVAPADEKCPGCRGLIGDPEHKIARQGGKPVNFGLGYGAGPKELQMIAWRDHNIWWDFAYCKNLRNLWLSIWSGVRAYHYAAARMCEAAAQCGQPVIAETLDGRRRWIDARTGYSAWLNHRVQGSSADMTKRAINEMKRDVNLILTVHDSIMAEHPAHEAQAVAKYGTDIMIRAGQHYLKQVPVTVDAKIMDRWGEIVVTKGTET